MQNLNLKILDVGLAQIAPVLGKFILIYQKYSQLPQIAQFFLNSRFGLVCGSQHIDICFIVVQFV